jgi:cell division protein FtsQ
VTVYESGQRFLRPSDVRATRRNYRSVQVQKILVIAANILLLAMCAIAGMWIYRTTQNNAKFAIGRVEFSGAVHTPSASVEKITNQYVGKNLFHTDIDSLRSQLVALPWIDTVTIEKRLPNTLRVQIHEKKPVAIVEIGTQLRFVDASGDAFDVAPESARNSFRLVRGADRASLPRCVRFLVDLQAKDPQLYSRVAEIRPVDPDALLIADADLGASVLVRPVDAAEKWRTLYGIARAEKFARGDIEYADLRFNDRVVLRPTHPVKPAAVVAPAPVRSGVTN